MDKRSFLAQNAGALVLGPLTLVGLYVTSFYSYLLFHSLIELFTVVVAGGIFVIAWNARGYMNNSYLLFVGIAALFAAFIDLLHALAYPGMAVFPGDPQNLSPQLWLAARFLRSISWLVAPLLIGRRLRVGLQLAVYTFVTSLLLLSIFYWKIFPTAYLPGLGLSPFKVSSEYILCAVLLAATALLYRQRAHFDPTVLHLLMASLLLTAFGELMFTSSVSLYSPATTAGHLIRLVAYYLLYKAIIETGLVKPYAILLRDLKTSDDQLRDYAAALQAQNEDLIRRENQMRVDAAALQARNEELDAFAHTVAHDLKNPLGVIITTADVINHVADLSRDELKGFLKNMKAVAFEMNSIIESLLLLAEVRKVEAPREPLDMAGIVADVHKRLDPVIKQYRGRVTLPQTWPCAIGYGPWVKEVWANYISNALKYGGPSPRVELGATCESNGMIRFWTRDKGEGIPPEIQPALFAPFSQRRKSRKESHGLGLSIVLRIVQKLGGQVGVESNGGKGSVFYFTLPAAGPSSAHGS